MREFKEKELIDMLWIIPAIIGSMCGTSVLFVIYFYLYRVEKKNYIGVWAISWFLYIISLIFTLMLVNHSDFKIYRIGELCFSIISSFFLIIGINEVLDREINKVLLFIFLVNILWVIIATFFGISNSSIVFPTLFMIGIVYIWCGFMIIRNWKYKTFPVYAVGISFILWGVHKMDYPILREIEWFAPWGYIISVVLELLIAVNFLLMYFQNIRNELIETQIILKESEIRLSTIIGNQRDMIFELNSEKIFTYASSACFDILGYNYLDIVGKSFYNYINRNFNLEKTNENNNMHTYEDGYIKEDKTTIYMNINCKCSYDAYGNFLGAIGSIRDVTEGKLLEEAIENDKYKTEFFSNISHELRTPLNVVLSTLQLLELYIEKKIISEDDKLSKHIYTMKQNSFRLIRLFNNLIDITKIDAGFFEMNVKKYNIIAIIEDTTLSVASYMESKQLKLQFDTEVEEKIMVCDADKIERIMLNLLSNAAKFTETYGEIIVNIYDKKDSIIISVKDTGIGIPRDKLDVIFERFIQVDKSMSRSSEGSGIGLSIVKSLIEMHKGKIEVFSTYGLGTEFIIEFPINALNDEIEYMEVSLSNFGDYPERASIEFSDIYN
jgi:PAS domain S-box-containing protein